jgi:excisionase family DNA binding protein
MASATPEPVPRASAGEPARFLTRRDVLDASEVADLLHLPLSTVLEYARRGVVPAHKLGRRWIFLRDEVDAAVRTAPAPPPARRPKLTRRSGPRGGARQLPLPFDSAA